MEDNKTLQAILEIVTEMRDDIAELKEGQNALRRDLSRVERKIDKQGNDVADTLYYLTNNIDREFQKLAK